MRKKYNQFLYSSMKLLVVKEVRDFTRYKYTEHMFSGFILHYENFQVKSIVLFKYKFLVNNFSCAILQQNEVARVNDGAIIFGNDWQC